MDTFDAVAYINEPRWQKVSLGLTRVQLLLEKLGRPQDTLRFVHVAGTNGKGSTCAYLDSILRAAGYRTGLFTSPYIECFEERIRVDGQNISPAELRAVTLEVRDAARGVEARLGEHPTEFELMCAVALCYFAQQHCDIVVLEVGLGGRLDATNVIEHPEVCAITPIALDHTAILGNTLEEIAAEKAGILKPGVPVVSWPQEPQAMAVVRAKAQEVGCPLTVLDLDALEMGGLRIAGFAECGNSAEQHEPGGRIGRPFAPSSPSDRLGGGEIPRQSESRAVSMAGKPVLFRSFSYRGNAYRTALLGSYQPANAALALEVAAALRQQGWNISPETERQGVATARWPGRFEVVTSRPLTVIDGGHNPQGARALADSLKELLAAVGQEKAVFVMGVLADKDYRAMIREVASLASSFTVYAPDNSRALLADDLARAIKEDAPCVPVATAPDAETALRNARAAADPHEVVVAFGSLYAIAALKRAL